MPCAAHFKLSSTATRRTNHFQQERRLPATLARDDDWCAAPRFSRNERSDEVDSCCSESASLRPLIGPLLRANILKLDEGTHLLCSQFIISSRTAVGRGAGKGTQLSLFRQWRGVSCQLPRPMQFREYLEQQRAEDGHGRGQDK